MGVTEDLKKMLRFSVDRDGETGEVSLALFNGNVLKFRNREEVLMLAGMLLSPEVDPQGTFVQLAKTEMILRPEEVRRLRIALVDYVEKALSETEGYCGVDPRVFHDATRLLGDLLGETANRMFIPDYKDDFDKGSVLGMARWSPFKKWVARMAEAKRR